MLRISARVKHNRYFSTIIFKALKQKEKRIHEKTLTFQTKYSRVLQNILVNNRPHMWQWPHKVILPSHSHTSLCKYTLCCLHNNATITKTYTQPQSGIYWKCSPQQCKSFHITTTITVKTHRMPRNLAVPVSSQCCVFRSHSHRQWA